MSSPAIARRPSDSGYFQASDERLARRDLRPYVIGAVAISAAICVDRRRARRDTHAGGRRRSGDHVGTSCNRAAACPGFAALESARGARGCRYAECRGEPCHWFHAVSAIFSDPPGAKAGGAPAQSEGGQREHPARRALLRFSLGVARPPGRGRAAACPPRSDFCTSA